MQLLALVGVEAALVQNQSLEVHLLYRKLPVYLWVLSEGLSWKGSAVTLEPWKDHSDGEPRELLEEPAWTKYLLEVDHKELMDVLRGLDC